MRFIYQILSATISLAYSIITVAGPQGGQVVGGAADIAQQGKTTHIHQKSDRVAIDWQSFNVAADETVRFEQPNQSSVALNTVVGNGASHILGRVESNGQVFLVNTRGIVFGKNSSINVGGLLATDLAIDQQDFMQGQIDMTLADALSKGIINQGAIEAAVGGDITLLGHVHVNNEGNIKTTEGNVSLISGEKAIISFDQDGFFAVEVTESVSSNHNELETLISNKGNIQATGGNIYLEGNTARDLFSQAVNNEGLLEATSIQEKGGEIYLGSTDDLSIDNGLLQADSITLDAQDELSINESVVSAGSQLTTQAEIDINAEEVYITNSVVQASHAEGGGDIYIGNWLGSDSILTSILFVDADSIIDASALYKGGAGQAYLLSRDYTHISGRLFARSQGYYTTGFIEASSKGGLVFNGEVDLRNPYGGKGTFLLDPQHIYIFEGSVDDDLLDPRINLDGGQQLWLGHIDIQELAESANLELEAWDTIQFWDFNTDGEGDGYTLNLSNSKNVAFRVNRYDESVFDGSDSQRQNYFPPVQFLMADDVEIVVGNNSELLIEAVAMYDLTNGAHNNANPSDVEAIKSRIQAKNILLEGGNLTLKTDVKRYQDQEHLPEVLSIISSEIYIENLIVNQGSEGQLSNVDVIFANEDANTSLTIQDSLYIEAGNFNVGTLDTAQNFVEGNVKNIYVGADITLLNGDLNFGRNDIQLFSKPSDPAADMTWRANTIKAGNISATEVSPFINNMIFEVENAVDITSFIFPSQSLTLVDVSQNQDLISFNGHLAVDTFNFTGNGNTIFEWDNLSFLNEHVINSVILDNLKEARLSGTILVNDSLNVNASDVISFDKVTSMTADIELRSEKIQATGEEAYLIGPNIVLEGDLTVFNNLNLVADNVSVGTITAAESSQIVVDATVFEAKQILNGAYTFNQGLITINEQYAANASRFNAQQTTFDYQGLTPLMLSKVNISDQSNLTLDSQSDVTVAGIESLGATMDVTFTSDTATALTFSDAITLAEIYTNASSINIENASMNFQTMDALQLQAMTFRGQNAIQATDLSWVPRATNDVMAEWVFDQADVDIILTTLGDYDLPSLQVLNGGSSLSISAIQANSSVTIGEMTDLTGLSISADNIFLEGNIAVDDLVLQGNTQSELSTLQLDVATVTTDNLSLEGDLAMNFSEEINISALEADNISITQVGDTSGVVKMGNTMANGNAKFTFNPETTASINKIGANNLDVIGGSTFQLVEGGNIEGTFSYSSDGIFHAGTEGAEVFELMVRDQMQFDAQINLLANENIFQVNSVGSDNVMLFNKNIAGNNKDLTLRSKGIIALNQMTATNLKDLTISGVGAAPNIEYPSYVFLDAIQVNGNIAIQADSGIVFNNDISAGGSITPVVNNTGEGHGVYAFTRIDINDQTVPKSTTVWDFVDQWSVRLLPRQVSWQEQLSDAEIINRDYLINSLQSAVTTVSAVPQIEDIALKIPDIRLDQIVAQCDDEEDTACQNRQRFKRFIGSFLLDYAVPSNY